MSDKPADVQVLEGQVARVVFRAPDGVFAVVRVSTAGRAQPIVAVGPLGELQEGETVRLEGAWEKHASFGEQLRVVRAVASVPRTSDGVLRYLEGMAGLGPELSRRLVDAFGTEALEVLEKESWRAAQVKGVGKRRAERVSRELVDKRVERGVMVFLQGLGVSPAYARRIRKVYGDQAIARVRENPYRLAEDIAGIGFLTADRIARGMGIAPSSPLRLEAGLVHVLQSFVDDGNVFAPIADLVARASEILESHADLVAESLRGLIEQRRVIQEGERVAPPKLHRAEIEIAENLGRLMDALRDVPPRLSARGDLSEGQWRAVEGVGRSGVSVITGGPGTGKTTVVRTIVEAWEKAGRRVALAAPTGRAARRLSEATKRSAQTLHRLLEWGRGEGTTGFARGSKMPLEADLVIVDETSMVDTLLLRALVTAVASGASLVLVGDVDQLPSVGPGQVLGDILASGMVPSVRLTEVFRQAEGSGIVAGAYRVLRGELPEDPSGPDEAGDFYVIKTEDPERARELMVKLCRDRIPQRFGLDPIRDLQVLTPMHRGPVGTEELNRALQAALNTTQGGVAVLGRTFKIGDKVMQVRNDYERDVFNGDIGIVRAIDEDKQEIDVDFEGKRARYVEDETDQLELAYAVSVHKSQGSEYPAVVLMLSMQHFLLLRRNLLYTAITRGKRLVVIIGSERALKTAVEQVDTRTRQTGLCERLRAVGAKVAK